MFNDYRSYWVVLLLALASWGIVQLTEEKEKTVFLAQKNSVDYFSFDYRKKELDENGRIKSLLVAREMKHYKDDGTIHLTQPVMTLYNQEGIPPWIIESESAVVEADGDNLLLQGKTVISRAAAKGKKSIKIITSELKVHLPTSYAETRKWSQIISPPDKTTGTGMKVIFKAPVKLTLLSRVKGRYEVH